MQPAAGKPRPAPDADVTGAVPAAPGHTRQITRHIRTVRLNHGGWIMAEYRRVTTCMSPYDAPQYARMRPTNHGQAGKWSGHWDGEVVLQDFAKTEPAALATLLQSLDKMQLAYDTDQARAVLVALACAPDSAPWELRPFGLRGPKPRRHRHKYADENGIVRRVYGDTMRRHADPNCPCEHCTAARATTTKK